ncbi:MAG: hypothetical protein EOP10_21840 [Proteobacteria bacterium]|nr:MAG: hypothetical protein EOP10_21840 [Pseudomonadota bacterium]
MRYTLILFLALLSMSCRPEGQLTRTLHAPHQKYLDRLNPSKEKVIQLSDSLFSTGLPSICKTASENPLCLLCDDENIKIYRCYDFVGKWTPGEVCHYSQDTIKCLTKDPPFALNLDYRNSSEKYFAENLYTWVETVHQIWEDKLSGEEKDELQRIILTLKLTLEIVTRHTELDKAQIAIFQQNFGGKTSAADAEAYLRRMTGDRKSGKLKLSQAIEGLKELTLKTHGSAPLFEKFSTMSLEGLEE